MNSRIRNLLSEIRSDIQSALLVPALSVGLTTGLGLLVAQIAFGTLIFSGHLAPYSTQGVGLILFGNFAGCLLFAMSGGFRGVIAGLSPALVMVMATIAASIHTSEEAMFVTVFTTLAICSIATGICCLLIGRFRLAIIMRFIPYPVAAGFVSGLGATVCLAGMSMMGALPGWHDLAAILEPSVIGVWLPGLLYGVALYVVTRRWGNPLFLPASVVFMVIVYALVLRFMGITTSEAGEMGILLTSTTGGGLWPTIGPADLMMVDLTALAGQIPNILTLMLVAFVCIVMNIASLEIAVDQEMDWDHEFSVTGSTSMVAGIGGATVATIIVPASLRSKLLNANTRLTGVICACFVGAILIFGGSLLVFFPTAMIGGILVLAGLGLLDQSLKGILNGMPRSDFFIIILIFLVMLFFGLVEGVGVGILAALAFFSVRMSRVDPVETQFTLHDQRSRKVRPVPDDAILQQGGSRTICFLLRGYLFFGSIGFLTDKLKESISGSPQPLCLVLDFASVTGLDISAINSLSRFLRTANQQDISVILSGAPESLRKGLKSTLPANSFARLIHAENLDSAIENSEDIIIDAWQAEASIKSDQRTTLMEQVAKNLEQHLDQLVQFEFLIEKLCNWLMPRDYSEGDVMATDSPGDAVQLLVNGHASARDKDGVRIRQFSPGDVITIMAGIETRTSSVVADEACRVMELYPEAQQDLEDQHKDLALGLYRYVVSRYFT